MRVSGNPAVISLIELALSEDLSRGDITTEATVSSKATATGDFVAREKIVVCGLDVAAEVCARVGGGELTFSRHIEDGVIANKGDVIATVSGSAALILQAERVSLNFLQRLCGVATQAHTYAQKIVDYPCAVVDTRKTTPGWRYLEKQAVLCGGAKNHRFDLSGGVLIKDNHIAAVGSVADTIVAARKIAPHGLKIEVEVTNEAEFESALSAGADIVLLDNMTPAQVASLVPKAKAKGVVVEVSGGITLETIEDYAKAGADVISSGALTHSVRAVDIGLDFRG